ncbi:MAG TPA: hypothetical protein VKV25_08835 [Acidimicrobiales bacterium]|nr:hypothetical protein [Acidimicrobiales bacterium]
MRNLSGKASGRVLAAGLAVATAVGALAAAGAGTASAAGPARAAASPRTTGEPYSCGINGSAVSGTFGDAGLIGWAGDNGVVACLGGSFFVKSSESGGVPTGGTTYGFGVYNDSATTWTNVDGYLPALDTAFHVDGAAVSITNFADHDVIGGHAYQVVYSRVEVHNGTSQTVTVAPEPTPGLVPLDSVPDKVPPGATVDHDYAVSAGSLGAAAAPPSAAALRAAGGWSAHFSHMAAYWNAALSGITQIVKLPDPSLVDAYKTGFIYTQIIRYGDRLFTGANGYTEEYSHDVIGILANLFTQGEYTGAHALLDRADYVIGTQTQYADGLWTYAWPWAIYVLKTGDVSFLRQHFAKAGPLGPAEEPSIEATAHDIAKDRTGPGGIMEETNDIDANGYWTIDNYEALMGLVAYKYLATVVGDSSQVTWATDEYDSLLADVNQTLDATISRYGLDYLPCSMVEPNTANRCVNPEDANWAAPFLFGRWAWDGYLFGAPRSGPGLDLIDATYSYGFGRLRGQLPPNTFGGYSPDFWSTAYNAGYGSWGLASQGYRDQGILSYQFMINDDQSGPYSWWESSSTPNPGNPWTGLHPSSGNGSSPHAWGMANANKVLLDSLAAQRSDGQLVIGRGVPDSWVAAGQQIEVTDFPTTEGHRIGFTVDTTGPTTVTLTLTGARPSGPVLFQLPAFVDNIAAASQGRVDESTGTVTLPPTAGSVTVTLDHAA